MTITTTTARINYNGAGSTGPFAVNWRFLEADDLVVIKNATDGTPTTLVINTDYTVAGAGDDSGGSITTTVAVASGEELVIYDDPDVLQETEYPPNTPFPAESHERALDKLTRIALRFKNLLSRAVLLPENDTSGIAYSLPNPEGGKAFGWNTTGTAIINYAFQAGTTLVDLAASAGSSLIGFIQSGAGAVLRTLQDKNRESVSVRDFGAVGDGVTDDLAAFNAAIASFTEQSGLASPWEEANYSNAGTLVVPPGWYYLSGPLELTRNIHLIGASSPDGNSFGSSRLLFSNSSNGIVIYNTATSSTGKGADGAIIENLAIMPIAYHTGGSVPAAGTYRGVWLRARARIINCTVAGWPEHGIAIVASVGGGGVLEGNANNWYAEGIRAIQNAGTGFYVDGADANAGIGIRIDASQNGERGIYDSSFLGNTYIGAHTAANTLAPYKTDNVNARCVFIGCYVESGQPISEIIAPSMAIGGINDFQDTGAGDAWTFGDKGLRACNGSVSEPSIGPSSDVDTGLYFPASGSMRLTNNGVNTGIFASGGGAKFSINGTYWGATQNAHEFVQNSTSVHSSIDYLTSTSYTGTGKYINCATASGTGFSLFTASNAGGVAFTVLGNGDCQNTNNSYGAISDIKLKESIVPAPSYWDKFKQYQFVNYNFIADKNKQKQLGLIAQQVEKISPGVVEEQLDYEYIEVLNSDTGDLERTRKPTGATTKAIKYSIVTLQAEIVLQEAMRRIEDLESRLNINDI